MPDAPDRLDAHSSHSGRLFGEINVARFGTGQRAQADQ